jgi:hypothetical protein
MNDHNTVVATATRNTTTSSSLLMEVFGKTVSDCLQDEIEMLVAEAVSELRQVKPEHGNDKSWDQRDEDSFSEFSTSKEPDQVSLLQSVGTTVTRPPSLLTNNDEDDERTDFLSERDQSFLRVPSKIAFKPRGRSYVLHIGEFDLMPVLEEVPEVTLDLPGTSPQQLENDVTFENSGSMEHVAIKQHLDLDPHDVVVQGREGMEILATKNITSSINVEAATTSKKNRWGLGRLSLRRAN